MLAHARRAPGLNAEREALHKTCKTLHRCAQIREHVPHSLKALSEVSVSIQPIVTVCEEALPRLGECLLA